MPCAPVVQKSAESAGVVIRQHKIIYKFLEDLENFVHDAKIEILESQGKALVEVIGSAKVQQTFNVSIISFLAINYKLIGFS